MTAPARPRPGQHIDIPAALLNGTSGAYDREWRDDLEPIGVTSRDYLTGTAGSRAAIDRMLADRWAKPSTATKYHINTTLPVDKKEAAQVVVDAIRDYEKHRGRRPMVLDEPAKITPIEALARPLSVRHGPAILIPEERVAPGTWGAA